MPLIQTFSIRLRLTAVQFHDNMYGKECLDMNETKMTVRVPRDLLENAKRYARQNDTTLTRLVSNYLQRLSIQADMLADAPVVQHLSGVLSQDISKEDYQSYLERKYGGTTESSD